jgi:transposase-like protein
LKRQSKDGFKGRDFEAWLIIQAVSWYWRYPLSDRNIKDMVLEPGSRSIMARSAAAP